ncbi:MAG: hypothetical protein JSS99_01160 [Actinobacteria bacterium]|nr:hypothetical protein [Actinomycetota bacterium]
MPTVALALPVDVGVYPWALLALHAAWRLPDWVGKWLAVRERWHRHRP